MSVPFYRAFEDRYRGSREVIKERLRAYTDFIAPLAAAHDARGTPANALDLGCGRGEWLELLGDIGYVARGVDLDEGMLAACRERGLEVFNGDALACLRACPAGSLALVSAFHLIEHIPFDMVQAVISEALRVLEPGGLLILETPNPENLVVGATSFYRDPSHLHPIPPELLSFATEHGGFARQRVLRLQEQPQLLGDAALGLINVLEGVSPDYSVVAQKAAPAPLLTPFDAAFAAPRGIDLSTLADRYERQLAKKDADIHHIFASVNEHIDQNHAAIGTRVAQLESVLHQQLQRLQLRLDEDEHRLGQNEQRLLHSEERLVHSEQRLEHSEQRLEHSEQRLAHSEQRLAHHEQQLADNAHRLEQSEMRAEQYANRVAELLNSTSWRITAPLRSASSVLLRLSAARRDGRLISGARRRLARPARRLMQAVLRRPRLKRLGLSLLRLAPGLRARMQAAMYRPDPEAHVLTPLPSTPGDLSPRAARIYHEFKQALEAKKN